MEKLQLQSRIELEKERLGSYGKVATRLGISDTALSLWMSGKYGADEGKLSAKIAQVLGYGNATWRIAQTRGVRDLHYKLRESRELSLFIGLSDQAGVGKSAALGLYAEGCSGVHLLRAREWTGRQFLAELIRLLGISEPKGYVTMDERIGLICHFFNERKDKRPQLIIDEADKLRPSALRILIPLYNECEDRLSVVISGTENLRKEIKRGVSYARKGYDELDSRFGRYYHKIYGTTHKDVALICKENGITDTAITERIWKASPQVLEVMEKRSVSVVKDMRLLKRLIQRELLLLR